jgi:hypothetical protein
VSFDVHPEHIYKPTSKEMRKRGKLGGQSSAIFANVQARERCRAAMIESLDGIAHDHARETVRVFLAQGLLDGWIDRAFRQGERNGYSKACQRARRGDWSSPLPPKPGKSLYGHLKAKARHWMAHQTGEFGSRELAAAVDIPADLAATYVSRAFVEGLLERREQPGQGVSKQRWYVWVGPRVEAVA